MNEQKAGLDDKETLRIWLAILKEKYQKRNVLDRLTPKMVGLITPSSDKDGLLYSI